MQISDRYYNIPLRDNSARITIITALFNNHVTTSLASGASRELARLGVDASRLNELHVPGAWELPLAAKSIFQRNKADAIIAIGCVIRGDTGHYDIVAGESARGLLDVSLEFTKPVMNAVLTVENVAQAEARAKSDATNKGAEAARALVELLNNLAEF